MKEPMLVTLRKLFIASTLACWSGYAGSAVTQLPAHTLGFDDISNPTLTVPGTLLPLGYGAFVEAGMSFPGFNWGTTTSTDYIAIVDSTDSTISTLNVGFRNGVTSPNNLAYNFLPRQTPSNPSPSVEVKSLSGEYVFLGAEFTGVFDPAALGLPNSTQQLTIQGKRGGTVVHTTTLTLSSAGPTSFADAWSGIDTLVFSSAFTGVPGGARWAMDDFRYTVAVPEPGTWTLLAAGLMLTGMALRRHL